MGMDNGWKTVAESKDVGEGKMVSRQADDKEILLVRRNGKLCACGNSCTHYGAPLSEGVLQGNIVVCPGHNSRFDVQSGGLVSPPALDDLPSWEVREEGGRIMIGSGKSRNVPVREKHDDRSFVVLGAGAAAIAAAETLRKEGFSGSVVLITAEDALPYDRPTLTKGYAAGKAGDDALPLRTEEFFERNRIGILKNRTVVRLDPAEHMLTFDSGETLSYTKLLLASGGTPNMLKIKGADLPGVFTFRTWRDAKAVVRAVENARKVVLVGSSFISMELASGFMERGMDVTVVAPGYIPFASVLGEKVGKRLLKVHKEKGVAFRLGRTVQELRGESEVRAVVLDSGEELETDLVIVGIGVRPRIEYLADTGLAEDGAVPVNNFFRTPDPDIYAAGDIAQVSDPEGEERVRIEHWTVAERQGMYAARSMLELGSEYREPPFFWTMQHGLSLQYIGHASGNDDIVFRGDVEQGDFLAGYYRDGALRAAAAIGMSREIMAVGELMRYGIPLPENRLADANFDIPAFMGEAVGKARRDTGTD